MKTIALFTVALIAAQVSAADLLVPQQYGTIQAAVNAASEGDRVLVSAGTYHEQVNLSGKGISLIGVGGAAATILDGDNIRTVIVGNDEPSTCRIQGFTIQRGFTSGGGGGVSLSRSSATFDSCTFRSNRASSATLWGAAAWRSEFGDPRVKNCLFVENESQVSTSCIYHYLGGSITISDCVFSDNTALYANAIHIQNEGGQINMEISRCVVQRNKNLPDRSDAIWHFPVLFWSPFGGTITGTVTDCRFDTPSPSTSVHPDGVGVFCFGYCGYSITHQNTRACGFPRWFSTGDSGTCPQDPVPLSDGGGNILQPNCCPSDLNDDGDVDGIDLGILLSEWGICPGCRADITGDGEVDGTVDGGDLGLLLSSWGLCP